MTRNEYLRSVQDAYDSGKVDEATYDVMMQNVDIFADEEEEDDNYYQLPPHYAEIEYDDFDNAEAIDGARFDDVNFLRYRER